MEFPEKLNSETIDNLLVGQKLLINGTVAVVLEDGLEPLGYVIAQRPSAEEIRHLDFEHPEEVIGIFGRDFDQEWEYTFLRMENGMPHYNGLVLPEYISGEDREEYNDIDGQLKNYGFPII